MILLIWTDPFIHDINDQKILYKISWDTMTVRERSHHLVDIAWLQLGKTLQIYIQLQKK